MPNTGATYYDPDGNEHQLEAGDIAPPTLWAMFAALMELHALDIFDQDDPGGVVFTDGGAYYRVESVTAVHRLREVEAAGGGAGTGVNDGDWDWVIPAAYYVHP